MENCLFRWLFIKTYWVECGGGWLEALKGTEAAARGGVMGFARGYGSIIKI